MASIDPLGQASRTEYDRRGNPTRQTDRNGQESQFHYDALSRLTEILLPEDRIGYAYDAAGNLTLAEDGDSRLEFAYDPLNRVSAALTADLGAQPQTALEVAYDGAGNRAQLSDSAGGITEYRYDAAGRLLELQTPGSGSVSFGYDASGRPTRIDPPNGTAATFQYDAAGRLSALDQSLAGEALTQSLRYDALGNLTSLIEPDQRLDYTYDPLAQLLEARSEERSERYAYDPAGNRQQSHLSANHVHDAANRLLADERFDYQYDANGNRTQRSERSTGEATRYTYDSQNRLIQVQNPDGTTSSYRYDALGRRIEKDVGGTITRYVYDGQDLALEYDGNNTLGARYSHGAGIDQPLVQQRAGQSYYYHPDYLGSIRRITNPAGDVIAAYDYDSYGQLLAQQGTLPNPYAYTGREWDAETGLYYYRARHYDPVAGRFLQEDPLGFLPGDGNLYRYVFNDPVNLTDPSGLAACYSVGQRIVCTTGQEPPPVGGVPLDGPLGPPGVGSTLLDIATAFCPFCPLGARAAGEAAAGAAAATGRLIGATLARAGRSAEDVVAAAIGIPRNTGRGRATVPGSGPGGFRVPDFDPARTIPQRGTVVEVKNLSGDIYLTPQLEDLVEVARMCNVPLEIFTNATPRGELARLQRIGDVVISPIP